MDVEKIEICELKFILQNLKLIISWAHFLFQLGYIKTKRKN